MGTEVGTGVGLLVTGALVGFTVFGGFVGLTGQTGGGVGQLVGLKGVGQKDGKAERTIEGVKVG